MIKSLKITMLLCLSLWIPTSVVRAHINSFATDQLKEMSQVMQLSAQLDSLSPNDTLYIKYQGKDVIVRTKNNRVNHIGYCIFTPEQRSSMQSPVFDFLERYVLTLDLPLKRVKPINNQLAEDGISFSGGDISSMPHLYNDSTLNLSVSLIEDKKYNVSWEKDNIPTFSIEFPASYDLLHGTEMSENERRLAEDLKSAPKVECKSKQVAKEQLLPNFFINYYILPGESYYLDNLNSNKYYKQDSVNGGYSLIFTPHYPIESISNLFTSNEINCDYKIDVTLKQYGFKQTQFTIPANNFVNYFFEQGCKAFFGLKEYTDKKIVGLLIMLNRAEGYCHTIRVTADTDILDNSTGNFKARIVSYIPVSRIKSLYEEYEN